MHPVCALRVVSTLLAATAEAQRTDYALGIFLPQPLLQALVLLHSYVRAGVCQATRCVQMTEMPDIALLMSVLPLRMRGVLQSVMEIERVGHLDSRESPTLLLAERAESLLMRQAEQSGLGMS